MDALPESIRRSVQVLNDATGTEEQAQVWLQGHGTDKYAFGDGVAIDCKNRIHLCRAACCRLSFALSEQDLEEGIVEWNREEPFVIAHVRNGDCVHLDGRTRSCGIYAQRPLPCRAFDCTEDPRIWLDFERRIPDPDLHREDWPQTATAVEPLE